MRFFYFLVLTLGILATVGAQNCPTFSATLDVLQRQAVEEAPQPVVSGEFLYSLDRTLITEEALREKCMREVTFDQITYRRVEGTDQKLPFIQLRTTTTLDTDKPVFLLRWVLTEKAARKSGLTQHETFYRQQTLADGSIEFLFELGQSVLDNLSPDTIDAIEVTKKADQIAALGFEGHSGVIQIELKTDKDYRNYLGL